MTLTVNLTQDEFQIHNIPTTESSTIQTIESNTFLVRVQNEKFLRNKTKVPPFY